MNVVRNGATVFFDVDETLVSETRSTMAPPVTIHYVHKLPRVSRYTMARNIELLKDMKARGRYIVVWSQGGFAWAEAVVLALGLQDYVDLIIEKPIAYVDDLQASEFMTQRIYLND